MGSYNKAYLFEITVTTPHGKGLPYQVTTYIPPLNGMPRNFACNIAKESAQLICHWEPPTDVNPVGFNVSRKPKNGLICVSRHFPWSARI